MHNADNKEAQAVLSLQPKLERRFRDYLALKDGDSGFLVANEWARGVEMP